MTQALQTDVSWPAGDGDMAASIRVHDWGATPLGPVERWPERLKGAVEMMLASPLVASVACGPERLLIYNDAAARLYGEHHPGALGRPLPETWPEAYATVAHVYECVFAGESVHLPAQPLAVSGDQVFDAYLTPVRDADGRIIAASMIGFEIGGRLRAEAERDRHIVRLHESDARQAVLLDLSDMLRPLADPVEIEGSACRLLAERLGVDRVYYVEVDEAAGTARVERDFVRGDAPSLAGEHCVADFGWSVAILRRGECHVIPDTQTSDLVPDPDRPVSAALGIVACMGAPLIKNGRLTGALCVTTRHRRAWTEGEVVLLQDVGERIWAAVERARAETALRESEARLAASFESVPAGIAVIDTTGTNVISNSEYRRFLPSGIIPSRDPALAARWRAWDQNGQLIDPHNYPGARALRGERVVPGQEMLYTDDQGRETWTRVGTVPVVDAAGRVTGVVTVISDIDLLKRSIENLRTSEARQRALIEGVPQLVWRGVDGGHRTWSSPQWSAYTGLSGEESRGHGWLAALHPDDRERVLSAWREAERTGSLAVEYRVRNATEERYRWFSTRATPVRDEAGEIVEWLGTSTDVDDLRAMQERQGVMVAELQHRTRNLLGVVRSISGQTLRSSDTLEGFAAAFNDRLSTLSRVQGLLSRADDEPITMDALIRAELDALGALAVPERVVVQGPQVRLRKGTVQTFALALHELATNARKYGALATDAGQLRVTWRTYAADAGRRLALEWMEIGLDRRREEQSPVSKPGGYGRELIERALPYVLRAKTTYELGETELLCTIDLPLAERVESMGRG